MTKCVSAYFLPLLAGMHGFFDDQEENPYYEMGLYSDLFNQNFFCIRNVDSAEAHLTDFGRNALKLYSHKCRNDFKLHDNDIFFQYQQIKNETKKAKKKIRKSENAVQDGGWLYYASLRKVRMRMNGIGIRNNDIEYIVFDNTVWTKYTNIAVGRPFFIQNAINRAKFFAINLIEIIL